MSKGLRIMIVEDDAVIGEGLHVQLRKLGHTPLPPVRNLDRAHHLLDHNPIDVVMLDIHLQRGESGIDLAHHLDAERHIPYIYLTAYSDDRTLKEVAETHPSGYLVKPFRRAELKAALTLVAARKSTSKPTASRPFQPTMKLRKPEKEAEHIFINVGGEWERLDIRDIRHLKSDRVYTEIHTVEGVRVTRKPLGELADEMAEHGILRIHRSQAINTAFVTRLETEQVHLGHQVFTVSRTYRRVLKEAVTRRRN